MNQALIVMKKTKYELDMEHLSKFRLLQENLPDSK
jgi:hypothetical protein